MSLNPKNVYIVQRTDDGTAWSEVYLSGSNLIIQTDANGHVIGSMSIPAGITASYALWSQTSSFALNGGGSIPENLTVNQLTASNAQINELDVIVTIISSSVVYTSSVLYSGSNTFGNNLANVQQFTGSVQITGSLQATSSWAITASYAMNGGSGVGFTTGSFTGSFTGSLYGTSSVAISASWAPGGVPNPGTVSSSAQLDNGGGTAFTSIDNVTFGQVTSSMLNVLVSSSLGVGTAVSINMTSARKYKENIENLNNGVELLNQLRPVTFDWKDKHKLNDLGFIADEVKEVLPTLVSHNKNGEVEGLEYDKLTAILASALQIALIRIDKLEERLNSSDRK